MRLLTYVNHLLKLHAFAWVRLRLLNLLENLVHFVPGLVDRLLQVREDSLEMKTLDFSLVFKVTANDPRTVTSRISSSCW